MLQATYTIHMPLTLFCLVHQRSRKRQQNPCATMHACSTKQPFHRCLRPQSKALHYSLAHPTLYQQSHGRFHVLWSRITPSSCIHPTKLVRMQLLKTIQSLSLSLSCSNVTPGNCIARTSMGSLSTKQPQPFALELAIVC